MAHTTFTLFASLLLTADATASQEQQHKSPRAYCTPLARALVPSSLCYDHLVGLTAQHDPNSNTSDGLASATNNTIGRSLNSKTDLVYVRLETLGSSVQDLSTKAINERLAHGLFELLLVLPQDNVQTKDGALAEIRAQILSRSPGIGGQRMADKCRLSMERFLCRMAYPSCHFRRGDASALVRPPCREDCLLLRDLLCPNLDWPKFAKVLARAFNSTLKSSINALDLSTQGDFTPTTMQMLDLTDNKLRPIADLQQEPRPQGGHNNYSLEHESLHFYWPHSYSVQRCEWLPFKSQKAARLVRATDPRDAANKFTVAVRRRKQRALKGLTDRWPVCSSVGLTGETGRGSEQQLNKRQVQSASKECVASPDGAEYLGTRNRTRSGLVCQAWYNQRPHKHSRSELLFDNMREAHNYCRNPGGLELGPWCYTQDKNTKWEYCDITRC